MEFSNTYCTIYIVRHGETLNNVNAVVQGQTDSKLTEAGIDQAKIFGQEFKNIHLDAVFSSDLGRAMNTAELIKLNRELAINTTKLLRERNFGPFEGLPAKEYVEVNRELLEKLKTLGEKDKAAFKLHPDHESNDEIAVRMLTFLREAAAAYAGKTILLVSHGSIMRAFLVHLGVASYDQLPSGNIDNLGHIKLLSDGVDFFVSELKGIHIKGVITD
jgi:broad specificity phosphatase PhoE